MADPRVVGEREAAEVAVSWGGGSLAPHTFGEFSMRGRVSNKSGTVSFPIEQQYETRSVSWSGPADSEHPATVLTLSEGASPGPGPASP